MKNSSPLQLVEECRATVIYSIYVAVDLNYHPELKRLFALRHNFSVQRRSFGREGEIERYLRCRWILRFGRRSVFCTIRSNHIVLPRPVQVISNLDSILFQRLLFPRASSWNFRYAMPVPHCFPIILNLFIRFYILLEFPISDLDFLTMEFIISTGNFVVCLLVKKNETNREKMKTKVFNMILLCWRSL